jgi:hypothetical protein
LGGKLCEFVVFLLTACILDYLVFGLQVRWILLLHLFYGVGGAEAKLIEVFHGGWGCVVMLAGEHL